VGQSPTVDLAPLGFSQKVTLPLSETSGGGMTSGRPSLGDISVTVPMSATVLRFLQPLSRGQALDTLSLEMCRSTETTGHCVLHLELTHVFVTGLDYGDSQTGADATAVLTLAPAIEKVTGRFAGGSRTVTYDATHFTLGDTGTVPDESPGPFLTSLNGPDVELGTNSWSHALANIGLLTSGGGAGAGKVEHEPLTAVTQAGPGSVELLNRLLGGSRTDTATISGCGATPCTQSIVLRNVFVTRVVLGSPDLTVKADLSYDDIAWDRLQGATHTTYRWDLAGNREL
jgi:type VI protein secretion system component Hcp